MRLGTHITLGIASSLILTGPDTGQDVVVALVGGALGGLIVDVDGKGRDASEGKPLDWIVGGGLIAVLLLCDLFLGDGIFDYLVNHAGLPLVGGFAFLLCLLLVGFSSRPRTFMHSLLGLGLFGFAVFWFCRPLAFPFLIGYGSHLLADLLNNRGIQLLYPLRGKFCFHFCAPDGKENRMLFWSTLAIDLALGIFLFSTVSWDSARFLLPLFRFRTIRLAVPHFLLLYLILINVFSFFAFERRWQNHSEQSEQDRRAERVETWVLDLLLFMGGGVGMVFSLLLHRQVPTGYNGIWYAFGYASILLWLTIYFYICRPFGLVTHPIRWDSLKHIPLLLYLLAVNGITALLFSSAKRKRPNAFHPVHTRLWMMGAFGGTLGGFLSALTVYKKRAFGYAVIGFPVMMASQILFLLYMMAAGVL